jgi:hypothetical protein
MPKTAIDILLMLSSSKGFSLLHFVFCVLPFDFVFCVVVLSYLYPLARDRPPHPSRPGS